MDEACYKYGVEKCVRVFWLQIFKGENYVLRSGGQVKMNLTEVGRKFRDWLYLDQTRVGGGLF